MLPPVHLLCAPLAECQHQQACWTFAKWIREPKYPQADWSLHIYQVRRGSIRCRRWVAACRCTHWEKDLRWLPWARRTSFRRLRYRGQVSGSTVGSYGLHSRSNDMHSLGKAPTRSPSLLQALQFGVWCVWHRGPLTGVSCRHWWAATWMSYRWRSWN